MELKTSIRDRLRQYPILHYLTRSLYRFSIRQPEPLMSRLIRAALRDKDEVFFIQVGSHDGITGDPIHNLIIENIRYQGIFIEPVPHSFERLKKTYQCAKNSSQRLRFENIAIAQTNETRKFYYLSQDIKDDKALINSLPLTYDQLSSFNRKHLETLGEEIIPYIVETDVPCLSLQELLIKHQVKNLDLIHIDVEGFDYFVLAQIDFSRYRPKVILYEHVHLTVYEKDSAIALLHQHDYELLTHGGDTLAILK